MPIKTDYEMMCRGCGKAWVPLLRKAKAGGSVGRFYTVHPKGCQGFDSLPPLIDTIEDLKAMVPGIEIRHSVADSPPPPPEYPTKTDETPKLKEKEETENDFSFF